MGRTDEERDLLRKVFRMVYLSRDGCAIVTSISLHRQVTLSIA